MNALMSCKLTGPYGKEDTCAQFTIDDTSVPFLLSGITTAGQNYTFSCWLKSEAEGKVTVENTTFDCSSETWAKVSHTFAATSKNLPIIFGAIGTYYIYQPQLEIGNTATDWTPAPEDVTESISDVSASLSLLDSRIEMRFQDTDDAIDDTNDKIDGEVKTREKFITYGTDGITISNGEQGTIKLVLDNTGISFYRSGQDEPFGFWDGENFLTGNIEVRVSERAKFGNFAYVPRPDGSLSLVKVGG